MNPPHANPVRIGFVGFGEAARAFHDSLKAHDPALSFTAYDIKLDAPDTAPAMREAMRGRGVAIAPDCAGLGETDWVFSAVTADQSLAAIRALAPHLRQGQAVIDINSVSPGRKRDSAALVEAANGAYLDMAVMAPVHPRGHRTPVLLAGQCPQELLAEFDRLELAWRAVGDAPGQATAIKMVRSLFVKGLEAITVETLLAAQASDCFDEIQASLAASFAGLGWPEFATYEFERTLKHGKRRAAEMRESAATLDALGLNGDLAREIADIQERMGGLVDSTAEDDLTGMAAAILAQRRKVQDG